MHEKLVQQLRDTSKVSLALTVLFPQSNGSAMSDMLNEAADIIEECDRKPTTNQEAMCKLSPEDFYDKLRWLWTEYGKEWTNSEYAIIEWLKQNSQE